ncbi:MAG: SPOR domain-containing protein [Candidatus Omnitrophota bacterium]
MIRMENQDGFQLELFGQKEGLGDPESRKASNSFLARIWNYEKAILLIIALITTSIISFSLGVEKGKRLAMSSNSRLDLALTAIPQPQPSNTLSQKITVPLPAAIAVKKEEGVKQPALFEKQGYVIQLASYKTITHAQKEAELLKKKGFSALVLPKGSYTVLYVGNFSNRETAQSMLSELKKRYNDCYIRRL